MLKYDVEFTLGSSWPERGALVVSYLLSPDPVTGVQAPGIPAGYIARVQWRSHPNSTTTLLELLPTVDYSKGSFSLSLDSTQTTPLGSLSHWGAQLESPDGLIQVPLWEGKVTGNGKTVRRP